jgi:hypothetical protein
VTLGATTNGGGTSGGIFQFGLSPVAANSTNTSAADIIYARIRPGNGNWEVARRNDNTFASLASGTFSGSLTDLTVTLTLDATNVSFSFTDGVVTANSGNIAHGLSSGTWDANLGFGMTLQSFNLDPAGPSLTATVNSLTVVPEPSTYALIGLGLAALVFRRRYRQLLS